MNRNLLISLIVGAILLLGIGVFVFTGGDDSDSANSDSTNSETSETASEESTDKLVFSPVATANQSFEATLEGTASGATIKATILYDGQGNSKYTGETDGQTFESYITEDDYIVCNGGSCFKLPLGDEQSGLSQDDFTYSDEDYDSFRDIAEFIGQESCPAGTCNVWQIVEGGATTKVFIAENGLVSKLTVDSPEGSFTYTYEYKDVTIDVPQNVQSLPTTL